MEQSAGQADEDNSTEKPNRRRVWGLIIGVLVVIALVAVGWVTTASAVRNDLLVTQTRPISCTGATVVHQYVAPTVPPMDVIQAKPGMSCTLEVRYDNTSARSVHVSTVTFTGLGSGSNLFATMAGALPQQSGGGTAENAVFKLGVTLRAGATLTKSYRLVWNPHPCSDNVAWLTALPAVEVSAMGFSGDVDGSIALGTQGRSANLRAC